MTIPEAKRITRMNEWKQLIYERQQSGQSVRAWCLQNGIHENSYYYWLRIIREEAPCEAENKSGTLVRVEPEKLAIETEPFPKKRTRKFAKKQNESLSFWEMLVQAARCVRRLASNCAGECHPNAECGRTEL